MARVYPERLPQSIRIAPGRAAECRVYQALSALSDQFTVFYSVAWLARRKDGAARDGEADFVVAHPDLGLLVIEVKGGGISYDARKDFWYSLDRGRNLRRIKDPVVQAKRSKHALLHKLRELPGWGQDRLLTIGQMVAFPDIHVDEVGLKPDLPTEIILDAAGLEEIDLALRKAYRYHALEDGSAEKLGQDGLNLVRSLLARSFEIKTPLGVEIAYEDERLVELTERQMLILDFLSTRRRAAIKGCAGSGKTMLAIEKARRLADQNFDVLLTCYNRALAEDLAQRVPEGVDVAHFHGLCQQLAREAGIVLGSKKDEGGYFDHVMPNALLDAIDQLGPRYDAVIVDEGQDFMEHWWLPLFSLLRDRDGGILYAFFDDNQNIYRSATTVPGVIDEAPYPLLENCRNTQTIHQLVSAFHQNRRRLRSLGPPGRAPEIAVCSDGGQQIDQVQRILHQLISEERVANQDLVILTPRSLKRSGFKVGDRLGNFTLVGDRPQHRNQVQVSTIHSFKGLERRLVILAEVDRQTQWSLSDLLYVGCSRARTHLVVVVEQGLDKIIRKNMAR